MLVYIQSMKNTDKQKQSRKPTAIRQLEIVDAAMQILATEGARQFTADRLGEAVGLASGSIFRHFSSMEEILDGVVNRIEEIIFEDFPPSDSNPLERLRRFFDKRAHVIIEHPEVSRLLLTSMLIPQGCSETRVKRLLEFKAKTKSFVTNCLKEAKKDGLLAADILLEESTILVFGTINAIGQMVISKEGFKGKDNLIDRVWSLLERTIKK